MDYLIFRPTFDAKVHYYGTMRCANVHDARRKMKSNPLLRGGKFYLVKQEDFIEVVC